MTLAANSLSSRENDDKHTCGFLSDAMKPLFALGEARSNICNRKQRGKAAYSRNIGQPHRAWLIVLGLRFETYSLKLQSTLPIH